MRKKCRLTENEVVLSNLSVSDFLVQSLGAVVNVYPQTEVGQLLGDLSCVLLLKWKTRRKSI